MSLVCFAERNKEGAARAAGDIRVAEQTSGRILVTKIAWRSKPS